MITAIKSGRICSSLANILKDKNVKEVDDILEYLRPINSETARMKKFRKGMLNRFTQELLYGLRMAYQTSPKYL